MRRMRINKKVLTDEDFSLAGLSDLSGALVYMSEIGTILPVRVPALKTHALLW